MEVAAAFGASGNVGSNFRVPFALARRTPITGAPCVLKSPVNTRPVVALAANCEGSSKAPPSGTMLLNDSLPSAHLRDHLRGLLIGEEQGSPVGVEQQAVAAPGNRCWVTDTV